MIIHPLKYRGRAIRILDSSYADLVNRDATMRLFDVQDYQEWSTGVAFAYQLTDSVLQVNSARIGFWGSDFAGYDGYSGFERFQSGTSFVGNTGGLLAGGLRASGYNPRLFNMLQPLILIHVYDKALNLFKDEKSLTTIMDRKRITCAISKDYLAMTPSRAI